MRISVSAPAGASNAKYPIIILHDKTDSINAFMVIYRDISSDGAFSAPLFFRPRPGAVDFPSARLYNDTNVFEVFLRKAVLRMRPNQSGFWRVIYIARGEQQARSIEDLLRQAGFMVDRKQLSSGSGHEDIEIRALDAEAEEARLFLMEQGL